MDLGSKLKYGGEILLYSGGKVIEKGSEVIRSDTVKSLSEKAGEGYNYLVGKIFSKKKLMKTQMTMAIMNRINFQVSPANLQILKAIIQKWKKIYWTEIIKSQPHTCTY